MAFSNLLAVAIVILSIFEASFAKDQCTQDSKTYYQESVGFMNCLGQELKNELNLFRKGKGSSTLKKKAKEIQDFWDKSDCPEFEFHIKDSQESKYRDFLKSHNVPHKVVEEIVPELETIMAEMSRNPDLMRCLAEPMRENFLDYLKDCVHDETKTPLNIPTKGNTGKKHDSRKLDPIPTVNTREHDTELFQQYIKMLVQTFLSLGSCEVTGPKGAASDLRDMLMSETVSDVCHCRKKAYSKDCLKPAIETCEPTTKCIKDMVEDPSQVMKQEDFQKLAFGCFGAKYDGKSLPTAVVTAGARMGKAVAEMAKNKKEKERFEEFLITVLQTLFSADFCSTECD